MACPSHKIAGVMQTVNSADGVLEANNAQVTDESANSERPKKREKGEPSEQSRDRSDSIQQHVPYLSRFEGQKSDIFDRKCLKSFFRNVLPTAARSTVLKNM